MSETPDPDAEPLKGGVQGRREARPTDLPAPDPDAQKGVVQLTRDAIEQKEAVLGHYGWPTEHVSSRAATGGKEKYEYLQDGMKKSSSVG